MSNNDSKKELKIDIVIFVILAVVLVFLFFILITRKNKTSNKAPRPSPTSSAAPLPTGAQYFAISTGESTNGKPKMSFIRIDPLDPKPGKMLVLTIGVQSTTPLQQISTVLLTDKKRTVLPLSLTKGTSQSGEWKAEWRANDTFDTRYEISFHLINEEGALDDEIVFR